VLRFKDLQQYGRAAFDLSAYAATTCVKKDFSKDSLLHWPIIVVDLEHTKEKE
jgi:hypothetical protein